MKLAVDGALSDLSERERRLLLDRRSEDAPEVREKVREIVDRVRRQGDEALREMARTYDGVELAELEVPRDRWDAALGRLDLDVRAALKKAALNIETFHRAQIPDPLELEVVPGVRLGRTSVPLASAGVYAPGGRAAYPSSVLMGVVPARAAGVREVVVCSPPGPDGTPPDEVLAACAISGATRLFAIGGAGAVAALAHGTRSVPRTDVVVGPGNRWVTEAKRQIAGDVRIDGPAGPSEVLVVAEDGAADPDRIAAELVAQAEHDPEAAVALVTPSARLLAACRAALARAVAETPRRDVVETALARSGALLRAEDRRAALAFARDYAPEHLALYTADPRTDLDVVTTAGTAFLGHESSVAFGDYLSGANHVLPTGGRARSFSGLSTDHFLRAFTWQEIDAEGARTLSDPVRRLAEAEGLPAHARAAELRAGDPTEDEER